MTHSADSYNANDKNDSSGGKRDYKSHWNKAYEKTEYVKLGWFEEISQPSLDLIANCNLAKDASILDVGSGATTLISSLVDMGYVNITAIDISEIALNVARKNLNDDQSGKVKFIVADITDPEFSVGISRVDLWHDRAVMHFLIDEKDRNRYLETLKKIVKQGGFVIIAAFSLEGAKKCSGLDVRNYDQNMISEFLGDEFELKESFSYEYTMPSGDKRPYIYTRFQRK